MATFHLGSAFEFVAIQLTSPPAEGGWTRCAVEISVNGFQGRIDPYFEIEDFVRFRDEMRTLYRDLNGRAHLAPREGQVVLVISVDELGHLSVSGEAWSQATYENKLEFKFGLDQTFLPEPIRELEHFLSSFEAPKVE
jgi:hypothetical protein